MMNALSILVLIPSLAFAGPPDWAANDGKAAQYPQARFFTGFGEAMLGADKDQGACRELAQDSAKRALIQGVQVTVKAVGRTAQEQRNRDYSEYVSAVTESVSTLDIKGLKLETYLDAKKGVCYALAAADRQGLAKAYAEKRESLRREAAELARAGRSNEEKGERGKALEAYLEARQRLQECRDAGAIAALAASEAEDAFAQFDKQEQSLPSEADLRAAVDRLAERPVKTVDDAAWSLAYFLKARSGLPQARVMVQPFSFRDTRMGSPFSRYFKQLLESQLAATAKWTAVEQKSDVRPKSADLAKDFAAASGAEYALSGSYWPQGEGARLIGRLRRVSDGGVAAAAELDVPGAAISAAKLDLKPENFQDALKDQGVFAAGELQGGGLALEAWTSKGADNLIFTRGEKMKVFVRMNLPGYVRLIYHLADRRRALLLDNYYLDAAKVNMAYELPQEFECDAPFGVETLQAFASTQKLPPLKTLSVEGYDILDEDLSAALVRTRGMKKAEPGLQKAEARIVLTTMEK